jgi:hypothetical protein
MYVHSGLQCGDAAHGGGLEYMVRSVGSDFDTADDVPVVRQRQLEDGTATGMYITETPTDMHMIMTDYLKNVNDINIMKTTVSMTRGRGLPLPLQRRRNLAISSMAGNDLVLGFGSQGANF